MARRTNDTNPVTSVGEPDERDGGPIPGLLTVFMNKRAVVSPTVAGLGTFTLGRVPGSGQRLTLDDDSVSREHTEVTLEQGGAYVVDKGSRNGTFLGGSRLTTRSFAPYPCVLRAGRTIVLGVGDCRPFVRLGVRVTPAAILGPALQAAHQQIERAAKSGDCVLLTGASGTGKELAARAFHAATGRKGPFVAVNCATIPSGLAERLLFGAKRGAYSGADADAEGYVQAANGGTLFLDELADLDPGVQPKLLRMLEEHEIIELGASRPRKVDLRVCVATLKDLRAEVAAKRFREDLYFRIGRPEVRLPSIGERLEEIPWLVEMELSRKEPVLRSSAGFLEACMTRVWPGNLRELLIEIRQAARVAIEDGRTSLSAEDLSPMAGAAMPSGDPATTKAAGPSQKGPSLSDAEVTDALRKANGNVLATARALGWHRDQVRRWLAKRGLNAKAFAAVSATTVEIRIGEDDDGDR